MAIAKTIGQKLNNLLENHDMIQRELGNLVGVTDVTIGRYLKDTR